MKALFRAAPGTVQAVVWLLLLLPIGYSIWSFRLYRHPDNPDAWVILAVWEALHFIPAYFILERSKVMRGLWTGWVALKLIRGYFLIMPSLPLVRPEIIVQICVLAIAHIVMVALLYFPSANTFFAGAKRPGQVSPGE